MSEWLKAGQMMELLKVGEIAENDFGDKVYWELSTLIIESSNGNKYTHIKPEFMKTKWRILPNYVSFNEAMKAMKEGATVRCYPEKGDDGYIEFNDDDFVRDVGESWAGIRFHDLAYGKWTIEE